MPRIKNREEFYNRVSVYTQLYTRLLNDELFEKDLEEMTQLWHDMLDYCELEVFFEMEYAKNNNFEYNLNVSEEGLEKAKSDMRWYDYFRFFAKDAINYIILDPLMSEEEIKDTLRCEKIMCEEGTYEGEEDADGK